MNNNKHPIIEIAGISNSGKSTIINNLSDRLNTLGIDYQYYHGLKRDIRYFPKILKVLLSTINLYINFKKIDSKSINSISAIKKAFQSSSRYESSKVIYKTINNNQITIIEEGVFSTIRPYLYGVEKDFEKILKEKLSEIENLPDYLFILNVDYSEIINRREGENIWIDKSYISNNLLKEYIVKEKQISVNILNNNNKGSINHIVENIIEVIK